MWSAVNQFDDSFDSDSPLHAAVRAVSLPIVTLLLQAGAIVDVENVWGQTPLQLLGEAPADSATAPEAIAEALLAAGADVKHKDTTGNTPLHDAWNVQCVKAVLAANAGADVAALNKDGRTPLHRRAQEFEDNAAGVAAAAACMDALLDGGADIDARIVVKDGLHAARLASRPPYDDWRGNTPLHDTIPSCCPAMVDALLVRGATPDARTARGLAPLDLLLCWAQRWGRDWAKDNAGDADAVNGRAVGGGRAAAREEKRRRVAETARLLVRASAWWRRRHALACYYAYGAEALAGAGAEAGAVDDAAGTATDGTDCRKSAGTNGEPTSASSSAGVHPSTGDTSPSPCPSPSPSS